MLLLQDLLLFLPRTSRSSTPRGKKKLPLAEEPASHSRSSKTVRDRSIPGGGRGSCCVGSTVRTRQRRGLGAALQLPLLSATTRSCCCCCCCISAALFKEPVFTAATPFPFLLPPSAPVCLPSCSHRLRLPPFPTLCSLFPCRSAEQEGIHPAVRSDRPCFFFSCWGQGCSLQARVSVGVLVSSHLKAREVLAHLSLLVRFLGLRLAIARV